MLELRVARLDDADALLLIEEVQRYYLALYGEPDDDPIDVAEFEQPRGRFLVGYLGGEPVAMGGWSFRPESPGDAKVRRMYVRPAGRRQGVAGTLLEALERDARAAGATRAVLATGEPQADAVRFYRSRGYADTDPFGFYADVPGAVFLARSL